MTATLVKSNPEIYVACLAAYTRGRLHGAWIDATQEPEEIRAEIQAMLKRSPAPDAEEWDVHDYDNFLGVRPETHNLEKLSEVAKAIAEHGEAVAAYISNFGIDSFDVDEFKDTYQGQFKSEADFVENYLTESGFLGQLEKLRICDCFTVDQVIDFEYIANTWFINTYWSHQEAYEVVHVFIRE